MLRITNLEELQGLLLDIPGLVDLQDHRDPAFVQNVKAWLCRLEKALESNRMALAGSVASLRASVISAERGVIPEGVEFGGRATRGNVKEAAAANALREAGCVVHDALKNDNERISEAGRMVRQLVALAKSKGLLDTVGLHEDPTEDLMSLWHTLAADADLCPGTIHVAGLVGLYDALIVLDRVITAEMPSGE